MQIQIKHISTGEGSLRGGGEKQFIHCLSTQDPNGRFAGGGGWVSRNDQANRRPSRPEGNVRTIEEGAARSTLGMSGRLFWRLLETGGHCRQVEQAIVFTADDDSHSRQQQVFEDSTIAIQSI